MFTEPLYAMALSESELEELNKALDKATQRVATCESYLEGQKQLIRNLEWDPTASDQDVADAKDELPSYESDLDIERRRVQSITDRIHNQQPLNSNVVGQKRSFE